MLSPEQRRVVAIALAKFVIQKTGVEEKEYISDLIADEKIENSEKKRLLNELAEKTDTRYFDLHDAGDPQYIVYFLRAKSIFAMAAALFASDFESFVNSLIEALVAMVPDVLEFDRTGADSEAAGLRRLGDVAVQLGLADTNPLATVH